MCVLWQDLQPSKQVDPYWNQSTGFEASWLASKLVTGLEIVRVSNRAVTCVCVSLLLAFSQSELVATLVKSLRAVADSSKPSQLETALSETLLISLAHLMEIEESSEELIPQSSSSSLPFSFPIVILSLTPIFPFSLNLRCAVGRFVTLAHCGWSPRQQTQATAEHVRWSLFYTYMYYPIVQVHNTMADLCTYWINVHLFASFTTEVCCLTCF